MAHCWVWVALLRGLDGPLLGRAGQPGLAGLHWAGSMRYGYRPSLGSTDPHYQLPSSSPSCMLPFRCCVASLSFSCLFLELADFYLLKRANVLWNRKVCCFFCLFVVVVFLRHTIVHSGQLVHTFHTPLPVPVNVSDYCTFLYTCIHPYLHAAVLCSRPPRETVE